MTDEQRGGTETAARNQYVVVCVRLCEYMFKLMVVVFVVVVVEKLSSLK